MTVTKTRSKADIMPFTVRPLQTADISQSEEIEREAFPGHFPPTSFRRELKNQMAGYLVASRRNDLPSDEWSAERAVGPAGRLSVPGKLLTNARTAWRGLHTHTDEGQGFLSGFLGTSYTVDEAHIISVGVRRAYRGRGIGELLLVGAIEQAIGRGARIATLEVRPSNHVARNLYSKYGFKVLGLRKGYYASDREDALIMSTGPMQDASYRDLLHDAKGQHERRWGRAELLLS